MDRETNRQTDQATEDGHDSLKGSYTSIMLLSQALICVDERELKKPLAATMNISA